MRLLTVLGIMLLLCGAASAQCITYFPDPATFPFPLAGSGSETFTVTNPNGSVNVITQAFSQTVLFLNPRDQVRGVFGASGNVLFQGCNNVFVPNTGTSTFINSNVPQKWTTTVTISTGGGSMHIVEDAINTVINADGGCPTNCSFDNIHYTKTYQYSIANGAYTINFQADRHSLSIDPSTGIRTEHVAHIQSSASGVWPVQVIAELSLYDNFNSTHIDPSKWLSTFSDPDLREVVRQLAGEDQDRRLHLSQRAYSATTDDVGASGNIFGLAFPRPGEITEISYELTVRRAVAVGCNSNPNGQIVTGAEFRGRFFNTESSPTSQLGDVETVIGANRNATDTGLAMEVIGFYERCDDANCSARTTLGFNRLGFVQPGAVATLHIIWEQPNHQFVFQLNDEPLVFSPYTVSDTSQPFFGPSRTIDLARVVPHCTTTPRPFASIDAFFSNVHVNASTVP